MRLIDEFGKHVEVQYNIVNWLTYQGRWPALKSLKSLVNHNQSGSLAATLRLKRFSLFLSLLSSVPKPVKILDIGGTQDFWQNMQFTNSEGYEIYLLNLEQVLTTPPFHSVKGNARNIEFPDNSFDVVFSNSVIEHLETYESQELMAKEVHRLAPRYYVQTPNYYFPIEPHYLHPFFQYLPMSVRAWLLRNIHSGHYPKPDTKEKALVMAKEIRLMKQRELLELFPDGTLYREEFMGLTKSFIVYGGWAVPKV